MAIYLRIQIMRAFILALFMVALAGCQCCRCSNIYSNVIDSSSDCLTSLDVDCLYKPTLDLNRIGKPDWCESCVNRLWCRTGCCKSCQSCDSCAAGTSTGSCAECSNCTECNGGCATGGCATEGCAAGGCASEFIGQASAATSSHCGHPGCTGCATEGCGAGGVIEHKLELNEAQPLAK